MFFALRTTLYSLVLITALLQLGFGIWASLWPVIASKLKYLMIASIPFSFATSAGTSILLYYNKRPLLTHILSRSSSHLAALTAMSIIWLAFTIMFATQFPLECNYTEPSDGEATVWCGFGRASCVLAACTWGFSTGCAMSIYWMMKKHLGAGLKGNVAGVDMNSIHKVWSLSEGMSTDPSTLASMFCSWRVIT